MNWKKLCCAAMLLLLAKTFIKRPELYTAPEKDKAPPLWVRSILMLTCTGVSFAHGSNDGQKGVGMVMLILIGLMPAHYALNLNYDAERVHALQMELACRGYLEDPAEPPTPTL